MALLVRLQRLDSELFEILSEQRGLPEEIDELRAQAQSYANILAARKKRRDEGEVQRRLLLSEIQASQEKIKKYKEAQTQARNNKEYDALSKQIEFEELEIKKAENKIKAIDDAELRQMELEAKGKSLLDENNFDELTDDMLPTEHLQSRIKSLEAEASAKAKELERIISATQADIDALTEKIKAQRDLMLRGDKGALAKQMLAKYDALRSGGVQNVVVKFVREACGGCNSRVPASKRAIIHRGGFYACETCGRLVVDERYFAEAVQD
ncbi:MAG: hypothetical protein NZM06_08095 [Chloroherpetonaceae bacterium]|nr:hypothetical protein [Chloroherpetonaceae bacterium]MDW8437709.1 hypothetical protein [Chloroherpetonaceae bacterium]